MLGAALPVSGAALAAVAAGVAVVGIGATFLRSRGDTRTADPAPAYRRSGFFASRAGQWKGPLRIRPHALAASSEE